MYLHVCTLMEMTQQQAGNDAGARENFQSSGLSWQEGQDTAPGEVPGGCGQRRRAETH